MSTFGKVEILTGRALACANRVSTVLTVAPLVQALAEAFCDLDDELQAEFFVETAAIAATWDRGFGGPEMQWWRVGRHLRPCACATKAARELVHDLAAGVNAPGVKS